MIKEIFLDMDNCFADFHKKYRELYNTEPEEHYNLSKNKANKLYKERFNRFIDDGHFSTLGVMTGFDEAIAFFENINKEYKIPICFLTSSAREEYLTPIENQKKQWLKSHNIKFNMMIVPGKRYKCLYAKPLRLLIDDTKQNIDDWVHHGGIGIHHNNWDTTISVVTELLNNK